MGEHGIGELSRLHGRRLADIVAIKILFTTSKKEKKKKKKKKRKAVLPMFSKKEGERKESHSQPSKGNLNMEPSTAIFFFFNKKSGLLNKVQ